MRFRSRVLLAASLMILLSVSLLAQGVTGSLTGTVTQDGTPLPGVTVTVSSPNLQGTRDSVTNEAGGYNFGALPPGDYTVNFALEGMQPLTRRVKVGVAQAARADVNMSLATVSEAIIVTATSVAVAETTEVQTNLTQDLIEDLPVARTITGITGLSPGVVAGVNGFQISGAQSFDNLYTVNGAVIQENLRGQPHNLFIEDAIQETTVQTAGVSAEFGNFTGGVVNAITKSGGNEFSGSIRDSLTNPAWTEVSPDIYTSVGGVPTRTPATKATSVVNEVYEGTLGGRIVRDRLWFFLAGRLAETDNSPFFSNSTLTYPRSTKDERFEGKLTGSLTSRHNLVASYMNAPVTQKNNCQLGCFDLDAVDPYIGFPNDFYSAFYNGVITNNFLVEAKYTKVNFEFDSLGGDDMDLYSGTPIWLSAPGFNTWTNAPFFAGTMTTDIRDNDTLGLKGTYYLGTRGLGNHNVTFGGERWHETRLSNNYQTPTGFYLVSRTRAPIRSENGTLVSFFPVSSTGALRDYIAYLPLETLSEGSDLRTDALYLNDRWDLNANWSFNLGARLDMNHSTDAGGNTVTDDSRISPRLAATYDPFANGRLRIMGSYGTYVGRLAESVAGLGTGAGTRSFYAFAYEGPQIVDQSPEAAARTFLDWFNANGGTNRDLISASIPGFSTRLAGKLKTPSVDEWTIGASTQIGKGFVRVDWISREWKDLYLGDVFTGEGRIVENELGQRFDLTTIRNGDDLERKYDAAQFQGEYRFNGRFSVGGNYTWSETKGNHTGEDTGSGPYASISQNFYPEYNNDFSWRLPTGFLSTDQTHKLRAWVRTDFDTFLGSFNVSALQRFDSGSPYQLTGSIDIRDSANFYGAGQRGGVVNPGYVTPPTSVTYFFSGMGEFRYEDLTATDLALNYNSNPAWLRGVGFFVQAEMLNIFNEDAATSFNTAVLTHLNNASNCAAGETGGTKGCLLRFNPTIGDTPVESVQQADGTWTAGHWRKGPLFGKPTLASSAASAGSFQTPRTYRVSVGFKF